MRYDSGMFSHPADVPIDVLLRDCDVQRTRRSGPGGQHRNKVATAIVITHRPTGLKAEASERRSQQQNQQVALFRLRVELALAERITREQPSAMWRQRTPKGKIALNPSHADYPAMLAEALDFIEQHDDDPRPAAEALGVSPTQLIKLVKTEPRAIEAINARRKSRGMHPLR